MEKFDPRVYGLMSKLQYENERNTLEVKYDALIKESRDKEIELDNRTDGIDMDLVKITDQFQDI